MSNRLVSEREAPRRIRRICNALEQLYGKPEPHRTQREPLEDLVQELLAEEATGKQAAAAFRSLRRCFVDWNEVRVSRPGEVQQALAPLADAGPKAERLVQLLNDLHRKNHALSLAFLLEGSPKEAREFLSGLAGVGEETAARLLLHALGLPAVALTPAVARVSRRVGLTADQSPPGDARQRLEKVMPREVMYPFHELIHAHARKACLTNKPRCARCAIRRHCQTGRALASRRARRQRPSVTKEASR